MNWIKRYDCRLFDGPHRLPSRKWSRGHPGGGGIRSPLWIEPGFNKLSRRRATGRARVLFHSVLQLLSCHEAGR